MNCVTRKGRTTGQEPDRLPEAAAGPGAEAGGRLVQQQEFGGADQRHVETAPPAAGELLDAGAGLLLQTHQRDDVLAVARPGQ